MFIRSSPVPPASASVLIHSSATRCGSVANDEGIHLLDAHKAPVVVHGSMCIAPLMFSKEGSIGSVVVM